MALEERWRAELAALDARHRLRTLSTPTGIDFCSNDYLGFGSEGLLHPIPATLEHACASRLLRGHHEDWAALEADLAAWHNAEAALFFTSGWMANEGLLGTICEARDVIFSDALNHASIVDACRVSAARRVVYRHCDLASLETLLEEASRSREPGSAFFIVSESLFSMDGDTAPLRELAALAQRFDAQLVVDEAHATGCFGNSGAGLVEAAAVRPQVLASIHTGGKALGLCGAYVCGSAALREILINRCRTQLFTTMLPRVVAEWWRQRLPAVQAAAERSAALVSNSVDFRALLGRHGVSAGGTHQIVSLLCGEDATAVRAATALQQAGFDIRAIRPPTVAENAARLRISIHANHTRHQLESLAGALAQHASAADGVRL